MLPVESWAGIHACAVGLSPTIIVGNNSCIKQSFYKHFSNNNFDKALIIDSNSFIVIVSLCGRTNIFNPSSVSFSHRSAVHVGLRSFET